MLMRSFQLMITAVLILGAMSLGGCASMNKDECLALDWRTIGYEDGVAGHSGDRVAQHRKACAKHGVVPDLDRYQQGRSEGLQEFCRPVAGFRYGARGALYHGVCPEHLESGFVEAYEMGFHLYGLKARHRYAYSQLESKRRELARSEQAIQDNALLIISTSSTPEQRAQALLDTRQLAELVGRLKAEIEQLERDVVLYEMDVEQYRASIPYGS